MTEPKPIACSLGAGEMRQRLDAIAALGAKSLVGRESTSEAHILRFRTGEGTRRELERILAAEAECCPFLDLELSERDGEVMLRMGAPEDARPLADGLAAAFAGGSK
jgi:hypothetical protein